MSKTHLGYEFPIWVTGLKIYRVAKRIIIDEKEYTVSIFAKGRGSIVTVLEFYLLRDLFVAHGFIVARDKELMIKGFEWTKEGLCFLKDVIEYFDPPPPPLQ